MTTRILSSEDIQAVMDMPQAIEATREAFTALGRGQAQVPLRTALETDAGVSLFMPAHMSRTGALGAKNVSVHPENVAAGLPSIHATIFVLDSTTGRLSSVMDGTWLTALRTGAAGGLAADLLSRQDAKVVAVFGAGVQARTQLEAVRCVRPIEEVRIVSQSGDSAARWADELQGVRARTTRDPRDAVAGADIIVAATNSPRPVFDGRDVEPGTHVTGVGSFTPQMREVDTALITAAEVFVDQREAALAEAGDIAGPVADGVVDASVITAELGEVLIGAHPGRTDDAAITFFKSVGNAIQDIAVAARVLRRAEELGRGTIVNLG